jgi:hypothetical protein
VTRAKCIVLTGLRFDRDHSLVRADAGLLDRCPACPDSRTLLRRAMHCNDSGSQRNRDARRLYYRRGGDQQQPNIKSPVQHLPARMISERHVGHIRRRLGCELYVRLLISTTPARSARSALADNEAVGAGPVGAKTRPRSRQRHSTGPFQTFAWVSAGPSATMRRRQGPRVTGQSSP